MILFRWEMPYKRFPVELIFDGLFIIFLLFVDGVENLEIILFSFLKRRAEFEEAFRRFRKRLYQFEEFRAGFHRIPAIKACKKVFFCV